MLHVLLASWEYQPLGCDLAVPRQVPPSTRSCSLVLCRPHYCAVHPAVHAHWALCPISVQQVVTRGVGVLVQRMHSPSQCLGCSELGAVAVAAV